MFVQPLNILRAIALTILIVFAAWNLLDYILAVWSPELRTLLWSMAERLHR